METDHYKYLNNKDEIEVLAKNHVDWLWDFMTPIVKQIAIAEFIHGYKHGTEEFKA